MQRRFVSTGEIVEFLHSLPSHMTYGVVSLYKAVQSSISAHPVLQDGIRIFLSGLVFEGIRSMVLLNGE